MIFINGFDPEPKPNNDSEPTNDQNNPNDSGVEQVPYDPNDPSQQA